VAFWNKKDKVDVFLLKLLHSVIKPTKNVEDREQRSSLECGFDPKKWRLPMRN
jgi:hypothetical protein